MAAHGTTLSESASKALLREFGVPMAPEREVTTAVEAAEAATALGFPVVAKLCGDAIAQMYVSEAITFGWVLSRVAGFVVIHCSQPHVLVGETRSVMLRSDRFLPAPSGQ